MALVEKPVVLDETYRQGLSQQIESQNEIKAELAKIASATDLIARSQNAGNDFRPVWDEAKGEFTNESIERWLRYESDGKLYGVDQTLDETQTCTKVLANAGIENPVPSTLAKIGSDPYFGKGPFRWYHVNGYVDDDGTQHVTGIKEFGHFSYTDGRDVLQLTPVRYVSHGFVDGKYRTVNSDTYQAGLQPEERSTLPNGRIAPYMLRAVFAAGLVEGKPVSRPYVDIWNRTCSHNAMNEKAKLKGKAYSGLTAADMDYLYEMYLLKYANKSSQNTFAGCTNHNITAQIGGGPYTSSTISIPMDRAERLPIGSYVQIGTTLNKWRDRNEADSYDTVDHAKIIKKEKSGSSVKLTLDCDEFFYNNGQIVQSTPWNPGATLGIVYDGSPTSNTSGREPFVLQGIECMVGVYECLGDVLLKCRESKWKHYLCTDTQKSSTDVTADYKEIYAHTSSGSASKWYYPMAMVKSGGVFMPWNLGASTTTGTGDGMYYLFNSSSVNDETTGFLAFGGLGSVAGAGLRCAVLSHVPGGTWWSVGSRLSLNGRNGVNPGQRPTGA